MALIQVDKVLDTINALIEDQRPVYDTIIDRYHQGRSLNILIGRRPTIPASSLPAIEIYCTDETLGWHACRVQQEEPAIKLDVTTDNGHREQAVRLEAALVTLTTRILASPPHLRPRILGTQSHLYDSLPNSVSYGTAGEGRMRVATISWRGKMLEYLSNRLFDSLEIPQPLDFPPY
jgi:hypothetical protein